MDEGESQRFFRGQAHVPSRSKVKADAEALLLERRHSASQGESRSPCRLTFEDMHRDMLYDREIRGCRTKPSVGRLVKAFGGWRATAIDRAAIVAYERKRLVEDGAARATVNQELASLRRMFNIAVDNGLLNESQKPRIKTPNPKNARQGFFEEVDVEFFQFFGHGQRGAPGPEGVAFNGVVLVGVYEDHQVFAGGFADGFYNGQVVPGIGAVQAEFDGFEAFSQSLYPAVIPVAHGLQRALEQSLSVGGFRQEYLLLRLRRAPETPGSGPLLYVQ